MVSGSFSLPFRGTFHLSLAVLVHYRLARVFSLIPWSGQIRTKFLPLCYLGTRLILFRFRVPDFHCLWLFIPKYSTTKKEWIILAPQPPPCAKHKVSLGFSVFARRYLRNHFRFLLLRVLECFLPPSSLTPLRGELKNQNAKPKSKSQNLNFKKFWDFNGSFDIWYLTFKFAVKRRAAQFSLRWVSPFGNHRIKGWLAPPRRYRCRQRPSSALATKASTICLMAF